MSWVLLGITLILILKHVGIVLETRSRSRDGGNGGVSLMPLVDMVLVGVGSIVASVFDMGMIGGTATALVILWASTVPFYLALAVGALIDACRKQRR